MPYEGQKASKGGHSDLIRNSDVVAFLQACVYMKTPGATEAKIIASTYLPAPKGSGLPNLVVASDSSPFSDPINREFPSTQIGYVKTSFVAFDMNNFNGLVEKDSAFVDPHKIASFHKNALSVAFTLPGTNVRYNNASTVKDGFRKAVYEQLSDDRTAMGSDKATAKDVLISVNAGPIEIDKCPSCGELQQHLKFSKGVEAIDCLACNETVYVTDSLRIHEQISDFGDNSAAITRFMNAIEHLLMCSLVNSMAKNDLEVLSKAAFMVDGPLALFGQPAKFHAPLQAFYNMVFARCSKAGLAPPLIIGIQKDGQVMEHARSLAPHLAPGTFRVIDDNYRSTYITGMTPKTENFGHETYYGQDFIFKTESGRVFAVCLPYPIPDKTNRSLFAQQKADVNSYDPWLGRAFDLIRELEFDLFENAVIPVALAHRHASISLSPGGKMLGLLTKKHLG